jgi:hypothetical protein
VPGLERTVSRQRQVSSAGQSGEVEVDRGSLRLDDLAHGDTLCHEALTSAQ